MRFKYLLTPAQIAANYRQMADDAISGRTQDLTNWERLHMAQTFASWAEEYEGMTDHEDVDLPTEVDLSEPSFLTKRVEG